MRGKNNKYHNYNNTKILNLATDDMIYLEESIGKLIEKYIDIINTKNILKCQKKLTITDNDDRLLYSNMNIIKEITLENKIFSYKNYNFDIKALYIMLQSYFENNQYVDIHLGKTEGIKNVCIYWGTSCCIYCHPIKKYRLKQKRKKIDKNKIVEY